VLAWSAGIPKGFLRISSPKRRIPIRIFIAMPFTFKLQTLLHYKKNLEEQAQLKLAREQQQLVLQEKRLAGLQEQRKRTIEELERRKKNIMPAFLYAFFTDTLMMTENAMEQQKESIAAQKKIIDRVRRELIEKMRQRKVIDQIRKNDYQAYLLESMRREYKENDEQALLVRGVQDNLLQ